MRGIAWPRNLEMARAVQESLREKVKIKPLQKDIELIAGVDAAFVGDSVTAIASLFIYTKLRPIEDSISTMRSSFPYIPGFLSFREGPAILKALEKLKSKPDLILLDGQGIAHPRGIGIASHIGVILNIPAIGCAKSRLVGEYDEPGMRKGEWTYLYYHGNRVGAVLRTRDNVRPIFVSPGHMVDIESAIDIVMHCVKGFRIPEPLRRAHHLTRRNISTL